MDRFLILNFSENVKGFIALRNGNAWIGFESLGKWFGLCYTGERNKEIVMIRVDEEFMKDVGLADMPPAEKEEFMKHAEEELEVRVGQRVGVGLSREQLMEFADIEDLSLASDWLNRYVPDFRERVKEVFENFKEEIRAEREVILA